MLLWDLTDPNDAAAPGRRPLTGHTDDVYAVAFARDGHTLATASGDGLVEAQHTAELGRHARR